MSLNPVFYIIFSVAVLVTIGISGAVKFPLVGYIIGWDVIYLAGRWFLPDGSPLSTNLILFQTVTECVIIAVATWLAYSLADSAQKATELEKMLTIPNSTRQIRNYKNSLEDIKTEFVRSRRYNHPLSLMVIEPSQFTIKEDLERIIRENQKKISRRYLTARLAEIIVDQARRTDMVMTKDWDGKFFILCPENNADGTSKLAQRIIKDAKNNMGISIQYGIATFPADALTLDDLVRHAETNMASDEHIAFIPGKVMEISEPEALSPKTEEQNPGNSTLEN